MSKGFVCHDKPWNGGYCEPCRPTMSVSRTENPSNLELMQRFGKREIDAEYVFYDVMKYILRHLKAGELCRVAQVCRSWNEAVRHEFTVRGSEIVSLKPYSYHQKEVKVEKGHIGNTIRTKPHVMISFGEFERKIDRGHEYLMAYKDQLPRYWLLSAADHVTHNSRNVDDDEGLINLSLPLSKDVHIKVAHCVSDLSVAHRESIRMAHDIATLDGAARPGKTALLVLGSIYYDTGHLLVQRIKEMFRPNSFTLWGGLHGNFMKLLDCQTNNYPGYKGREGAVVVALSGIDSHSLIVNSDLVTKQFQQELASFRCRIEPPLKKRGNYGLVYTPLDDMHKVENVMKQLEKMFPEVDFVGCCYEQPLVFGLDSTRNADQELVHQNAISIMILRYS